MNDMMIHLCDTFIHVNRTEFDGGVLILIHHKQLMCKALPYPFRSLKIKDHLLKLFQPITDALGLRAGHQC